MSRCWVTGTFGSDPTVEEEHSRPRRRAFFGVPAQQKMSTVGRGGVEVLDQNIARERLREVSSGLVGFAQLPSGGDISHGRCRKLHRTAEDPRIASATSGSHAKDIQVPLTLEGTIRANRSRRGAAQGRQTARNVR
jgi:hypothetical protein